MGDENDAMMSMDDDTPIEWSCHSSPFLEQKLPLPQQRQDAQMSTPPPSASPPSGAAFRRPHPSPGVGLAVGGADAASATAPRGSKRARHAVAAKKKPARQAVAWWNDNNKRNGSEMDEEGSMDYSAGLAGGDSAAHPNDMVVAGGVGQKQQKQRQLQLQQLQQQSGALNSGGRGWPTVVGMGGGGGGLYAVWERERGGDASGGGAAVIASGFGSGGFPQHQWHQDQGGSNDDMLILYGSPS